MFTVYPLQEPLRAAVSGFRKQCVSFAVYEGARLVAVFRTENEAGAYAMRRNQLNRKMG